MKKIAITLHATIDAPVEKVWKCWTSPEDIVRWNQASDDWHTTRASNDLRPGGRFNSRMEAKDGSMGFDFWGVYDHVVLHKQIDYTMGDGRKVSIAFSAGNGQTRIVETFETEDTNSVELQQTGWQAILDAFKDYTEKKS